jgi:hypothetical protein
MSMRQNQISVPLDRELRKFVEQAAERDDRSVAAWIRHIIAKAARASPPPKRRAA